MKVSRLADSLAAEVTDVDLSDHSIELKERIYEAFLEHQVLVIRDQKLSPIDQVRFSERFGELEWQENARYTHPEHEKVLILSNELDAQGQPVGLIDAGDFWHSDSSHHVKPVTATILMSVKVPQKGGSTDFCSMYAVYDALPENIRSFIKGKYGIHHISKALNPRVEISKNRPDAKDFYTRTANENSFVFQPMVRTHDETGRQALYVSPRFTIGIKDVDDEVGQPLLDNLFSYITDSRDFHYQHFYKPGDLVIWDNRCVVHRAMGGYDKNDIRRLHRTTIIGNEAFFNDSST